MSPSLDRGSFVFTGTVQQLDASTMEQVSADERSAIVRVDEVLQAPDILRHVAGQDITVYLGDHALQQGDLATFYTQGLVFGESIAVHATEIERMDVAVAAAAAAAPADPVDALRAQRAEERFTRADLVVKGRVKSVQEPPTPPADVAVAAAAAAGEPQTTRYSEHDPVWMTATVEVEEVHKGDAGTGQTVEIMFPASTDVAWHRAPKFKPGQEGVFLLHQEPAAALPDAVAVAAAAGEPLPYTALDPADFHSAETPQVIDSVLSKHQ